MRRLSIILLLLALPVRAETPIRWLPLDEALTTAKANDRLILLYLRGTGRRDKSSDEWIEHLTSNEDAAKVLADLVPATAQNSKLTLPDLQPYRDDRSPRLLLLDPGGGFLYSVDFAEYGNVASMLAQLRRQAGAFVASAKAREENHIALSLLLRGHGLLQAGVPGNQKQLLTRARDLAIENRDQAVAQNAELDLATIAADEGYLRDAVKILRRVAEQPARPSLGASAWLLLGHYRRELDDRKGAVEAYQNAWRLAAKPSPIADSARRFLEMMGSEPESDLRAVVAAGAVRLLYPHRAVLAGDVEVSAVVPAAAARVEFFVDDARIAERTSAPFTARVPLGNVPRVHTIRVVAFDANEARLGEDAATVNERTGSLTVEIVAPRDLSVESKTVVEVQPHVPEGDHVARVDIYWNEKNLATLTKPPWRYELQLPAPHAFGYVRAVTRDAAGATAEDAKLINGAGSAEEVRVDAVELYAIVQDRAGHNVEGLTANDFAVKEDGVPVAAEVHNDPNEPITVGMAVDVSGSMRTVMASVMEDATEFLRHSLEPRDQTFVVSFTESPELYQPLTSDFEHVSASIFDMRAYGETAMWDAVVFSLDQLRGLRGKRALLLFTDGVDTGSRTGPKAVIEYAHEVGVPVYVVLFYTGPVAEFATSSGSVSVTRIRSPQEMYLQRLTDETGGALIRYPRQKDLPKLFQQVRDDTRGAYALTFVSRSAKKRTELRKLSVAVTGRRGAAVRAPSAYYPR
jgi:VWFA-related protein